MKENKEGIPTRLSWNNTDHDLVESVISRLKEATQYTRVEQCSSAKS